MSDISPNGNKNNAAAIVSVDYNIKVKLRSNEGNVFEIDLAAAKMSVLVMNMLESLKVCDGQPNFVEPIPLINDSVNDEALKKIIEWCEFHFDDPPIDEDFEEEMRNQELSHWDKKFIDVESQALLFDIIVAANYMDIKGLVEVGGKHICNKIKGKSCEEVRQILKITNDFTPEEEAEIHKQNEWIYHSEEHAS